jgi:hypothetical protein
MIPQISPKMVVIMKIICVRVPPVFPAISMPRKITGRSIIRKLARLRLSVAMDILGSLVLLRWMRLWEVIRKKSSKPVFLT